MRDTSRLAYAEQRETGKLAHTQGRIVAWLKARPGQSFTRAEIARGTGLSVASCCGRVNELLHVKRCLVEEPRRICTISGKAAHPVRVA